MTTHTDQCRTAFESQFSHEIGEWHLAEDDHGEYQYPPTRLAWQWWQKAWTLRDIRDAETTPPPASTVAGDADNPHAGAGG